MTSTSGRDTEALPYHHYDEVAEQTAALVIRSYSSSFGLASRLLTAPVRRDVHNIYALVRVADEIVDAPRPGQTVDQRRAELDALEKQTHAAMATGTSTNLVVHAFARTARRTGIDESLTAPFFASMRMDLEWSSHDAESLATYIYGSAEVVGLMCVHAFLADEPHRKARYDQLAPGARRLGAAFQKINFLRDIGADSAELGRRYLVGLDPERPSADTWHRWLDDIDDDLACAQQAIPLLPSGTRVAVCTAHDLFAELARRLRATPPQDACRHRVRVPGPAKARIAAAAAFRRGAPRRATTAVNA
ncbi:phytoene/squalene synthase family protein [Gordonia sp. Z-3]|uniref:Phytoene/squalene synthase family protein n=1 Tax=Gordonia aquimaris TaxID=2984863 RepID=A0A9X3D7W1_9ACTN|nr:MULTISPECIES: phytoene/squalene synthase family protein [Gordonia]MCX2966804.1 phytoene/squalene synthase family protein [Gordonia aquimaris]MED5803323.1 phytoene/squalene synthase family protein [Gordonia sp. Z-3]